MFGRSGDEVAKKHPNLIRAGVFSIDKVLPFVKSKQKPRVVKHYDGIPVYMDSLRYHTFLRSGVVCVTCGLVATFFALESTPGNNTQSSHYHFNLYGVDDSGDEVLFTKDHIHPRSKGGKDHLTNLQTMCMVCNTIKGST